MPRSWKSTIDRVDVTLAVLRLMLAGILVIRPAGQLVSFMQAAWIINSGVLNFPLMLNAAVPMLFVLGGILLMIGFKTRYAAGALVLLIASFLMLELAMFGAPESAGAMLPRLACMVGLMIPAIVGGGRLSLDGVLRSRPVPTGRIASTSE